MSESIAIDDRATIHHFLSAAAAKQPTPGGGSVAALAGALAASMGSMVLNYSVQKNELQQYRAELDAALASFNRARLVLLELMVEDQLAYLSLTDARRQRSADEKNFDEAVTASIRIPQAIGATAIALLSMSEKVASKVNPFLLSDLAVCADLATATVRCASYNVHANLPDLRDSAERNRIREESVQSVRHAVTLVQEVMRQINTRLGTPA